MAAIDKSAMRISTHYEPDELKAFVEYMNGDHPYDDINIFFNASDYYDSDEQKDKNRELGKGRHDKNIMNMDCLFISRSYNPEYQTMYHSRGGYYCTMEVPFISLDPQTEIIDSEWHIHWGSVNTGTDIHLKNARMSLNLIESHANAVGYVFPENLEIKFTDPTDGRFLMSTHFYGTQIAHISGYHQNSYDRGY